MPGRIREQASVSDGWLLPDSRGGPRAEGCSVRYGRRPMYPQHRVGRFWTRSGDSPNTRPARRNNQLQLRRPATSTTHVGDVFRGPPQKGAWGAPPVSPAPGLGEPHLRRGERICAQNNATARLQRTTCVPKYVSVSGRDFLRRFSRFFSRRPCALAESWVKNELVHLSPAFTRPYCHFESAGQVLAQNTYKRYLMTVDRGPVAGRRCVDPG